MATSSPMTLQKCIACRAQSVPRIVRLHRGSIIKGWHDVSDFVQKSSGEPGEMSDRGTQWLCDCCTRGTLQCGKCKTRFNSTEERCPACNPKEPTLTTFSLN
jgi:hypothetical protein